MARLPPSPAAAAGPGVAASVAGAGRPSAAAWSVPLALLAAILAVSACRAREGERCVCAEDCREGFLCVASGRVLAPGECSPTVGQEGGSPGVCLSEEEAAEDEGGVGQAEPFMDLGSKLDFEPGPLPDDDTGATGATESGGTTTEATGSTGGTTDATGTGSTGGSSSGTTDATGTGSTGGTTDATGSTGGTGTGSTSVGT